jgi:hypothetical protein
VRPRLLLAILSLVGVSLVAATSSPAAALVFERFEETIPLTTTNPCTGETVTGTAHIAGFYSLSIKDESAVFSFSLTRGSFTGTTASGVSYAGSFVATEGQTESGIHKPMEVAFRTSTALALGSDGSRFRLTLVGNGVFDYDAAEFIHSFSLQSTTCA